MIHQTIIVSSENKYSSILPFILQTFLSGEIQLVFFFNFFKGGNISTLKNCASPARTLNLQSSAAISAKSPSQNGSPSLALSSRKGENLPEDCLCDKGKRAKERNAFQVIQVIRGKAFCCWETIDKLPFKHLTPV